MNKNSVLVRYIARKKGLLLVSGLFSLVSTLAQLVPYYSVYRIIELLMMHDYDGFQMRYWGIVALGSLLIAVASLFVSNMCSHIAAFDMLYQIRLDLVDHLSKLSLGYYTSHASGQMIKIIDQSVEKIESFVAHQIPDLVSALLFPVIYIGVMFVIDWRLALVAIIPVVMALIIQSISLGNVMKNDSVKRYHNALEEMSSNGIEYIKAMPAVKVFRLNVDNFKRFHHSILDYKQFVLDWTLKFRTSYIVFTTLIFASVLCIIPMGVWLVSSEVSNRSMALTVILFVVLSAGLGTPLLKLMYATSTFSNVAEGAARIDEMFNEAVIVEGPLNDPITEGAICYRDVSFAYNEGDLVLNHISLEIKPQTITALVGPSGGGKSTIAQLLLRFYDPQSGSITIGGVDIRQLSTAALMRSVSFVFQDVYLFSDTVEENIRMGNRSASMDEVIRVATMARCHEFILDLDHQYQTVIGEGATHLSKGEAQRISIARALLKQAPILVLDEATAYADAENEIHIQQAISELVKGKTVLVIAHRLWTIKNAHQIIVCHEGRIEESGAHQSLIDHQGLYAKLWAIADDSQGWKVRETHA